MRNMARFLSFLLLSLFSLSVFANGWIRINQLGYLPQSVKVAVLMNEEDVRLTDYRIVNYFTGETVRTYTSPRAMGPMGSMKETVRLDFSDLREPGVYYIEAAGVRSPHFPVNAHVYDGTADFLLNYMRQQRCGYNPFVQDSCHTHDAYIVYHPTKTGQHLDVRGGWHDAADYLQYTTTSANAIYQMMFAYDRNPSSFADVYDANGHKGSNGIPDIVDEIKWGMDWLNRMNPAPGELYNQLADDRDHRMMCVPQKDKVDYGYGPGMGRPVYFCTGEPQQRGKYMNATTGVASTAGKFASCFALGQRVLAPFYPDLAREIGAKAEAAYNEGIKKPGVCQTASVVSPYIYEEFNWADDMELGAMELYHATGRSTFLEQALAYGRLEPVTPWMGADSARHYQWYPFMNMGHYHLAHDGNPRVRSEFLRNMRSGIRRVYERGQDHPFLNGIPFIWCSNNLTVAMLTQCRLYAELSGDDTFAEMEASLRDWLFGCNPWGTSMIVELPLSGDYPVQSHTAMLLDKVGNTPGGLVDGPVYRSIFEGLIGVSLAGLPGQPGDDYRRFQPQEMVYHDAIGDYSTNECTMDGTASLTYYLSAMQQEGLRQSLTEPVGHAQYVHGGIVRTDPAHKTISLLFTAADKADGADAILRVLQKHGIKGSFFFTGEFFERFPDVVSRLLNAGHYVGSHSYGHLLYAPWEKRDSLLVTRQQFDEDMLRSYAVMQKAGISPADAPLFIPPYEYYNAHISAWARQLGIQLINFTPGTLSNADYTTPDMGKSYRSSADIYARILKVEREEGLNGFLLLFHLGTDARRTDKYYDHYLDKTIRTLLKKGYRFTTVREATGL